MVTLSGSLAGRRLYYCIPLTFNSQGTATSQDSCRIRKHLLHGYSCRRKQKFTMFICKLNDYCSFVFCFCLFYFVFPFWFLILMLLATMTVPLHLLATVVGTIIAYTRVFLALPRFGCSYLITQTRWTSVRLCSEDSLMEICCTGENWSYSISVVTCLVLVTGHFATPAVLGKKRPLP